MRIEYDREADAVYFYLRDTKIIDSEEIAPGVVYDFDQDEQVVGIEVLNVKRKTTSKIIELTAREDFPLLPSQKEEFKRFFDQVPATA